MKPRPPRPLPAPTPVAHLGLGSGPTHPGTLEGCAACARYVVEHPEARLPAGVVFAWEAGVGVLRRAT